MKITPNAEKDIEKQEIDSLKLTKKIQEELSDLDRNKVEIIERPSYDAVFHRLKIKDGKFDHRIHFDY